MLCPKCKHRNPDENRFCGRCGYDLTKSALTVYPREGYDDADPPPVSNVQSEAPRLGRDVSPLASARTEPVQEKRVPAPVPSSHSEGIHGPSFLGLADAPDPDFLADLDEPRSHARRNWLLFALALVLVLAFGEWRNLRNSGINLAGTMKLILPDKKVEQPKPPEAGATDTQSENSPANGKPDKVVNPVNRGAAGQQSAQGANAQSANSAAASGGATQQGTASPPGAAAPTSPSSSSNSAAQPPNASEKTDNASPQKTPTADKQQAQETREDASNSSGDANADTSGNDSATGREDSSPKVLHKARVAARAAKSTPVPPAGEEELARAESASSPEMAARWLWAATSKGNLDAPIRLADMYAAGRGVPRDCEQATVLLRSSARRGNPRALARLGVYYATGRCVQQDRAQAWHYLSLAYRHDPASDWIRQYREHLWSRMTAEERARAGNGPTTNASE